MLKITKIQYFQTPHTPILHSPQKETPHLFNFIAFPVLPLVISQGSGKGCISALTMIIVYMNYFGRNDKKVYMGQIRHIIAQGLCK